MENLNILSLILAALVPMVMGMIWYSKPLFGKAWMDSIGMTEEKQRSGNMAVMMGVSLIMAFLIAFFMVNFCNGAGQEGVAGEFDTFKHGAMHGIILSFFVIIPIFISNGLFEQKTWKNMLINGFYWMVTLAIMGGIVDAMNHFPN